MELIEKIKQKARKCRIKVVLPESLDERVLRATEKIIDEEIASVVLLGDESEIEKQARKFGVKLDGVIIDNQKSPKKRKEYAELLYSLRKEKGITRAEALETLEDEIYWAAMMVKSGDADGYVAGATHSTGRTLRPAFQIVRPREGISSVSSFSIMLLPRKDFGLEGILFFADTGVIPDPTAAQLAEIAILTAESFGTLVEEKARVAMLSFSTKGSARHRLTQKVQEATEIAKEKAPELAIDGEIQADSALVPDVARRKMDCEGEVAGRANVLIFPDLNCANIAYKLVERLAGARAIGPITQGLRRPANDLSRGCNTEDIVGAVAVTAVQAQVNS